MDHNNKPWNKYLIFFWILEHILEMIGLERLQKSFSFNQFIWSACGWDNSLLAGVWLRVMVLGEAVPFNLMVSINTVDKYQNWLVGVRLHIKQLPLHK